MGRHNLLRFVLLLLLLLATIVAGTVDVATGLLASPGWASIITKQHHGRQAGILLLAFAVLGLGLGAYVLQLLVWLLGLWASGVTWSQHHRSFAGTNRAATILRYVPSHHSSRRASGVGRRNSWLPWWTGLRTAVQKGDACANLLAMMLRGERDHGCEAQAVAGVGMLRHGPVDL